MESNSMSLYRVSIVSMYNIFLIDVFDNMYI